MASGDTLFVWDAQAARPPATNYATLDVRNGHVVLDFDDTVGESADFFGVVPDAYSGANGQLAIITWAATSATSGDVVWEVQVERQQPSTGFDVDADAFLATASVTTSVGIQSGTLRQSTLDLNTLGLAFLPHAGEPFRLRISRDAADSADTIAGDAELLAVELRES